MAEAESSDSTRILTDNVSVAGLYLGVFPIAVLGVLLAVSILFDITFGTLVLVLSVVMTVVLVTSSGWNRRAAASSRFGVLFQHSDQRHVGDVGKDHLFDLPMPVGIAIVLITATLYG